MGLTYDATGGIRQKQSIKSDSEKILSYSKDFPNCNGLFPDCPETPDLINSMCRTCPKTEGLKKPKLEE